MNMKIYVGNLPFKVDSEGLKGIFASYGDIEEAIVISDKFSGRSKGFGFVTFKEDASGQKAIAEMNGKEVEGRELKVNEAKPMEERPPRRDFDRR
jgi:RNA recognition motif-containing protein